MVQFKIQSKLKNFFLNVKLRKFQFSMQIVWTGKGTHKSIRKTRNCFPLFSHWPFIWQASFVTLLLSGQERERSWPLSCDTGPQHRSCFPTNPRNASNRRDQRQCHSSGGRTETYIIFAPATSAMPSEDNRRATQRYTQRYYNLWSGYRSFGRTVRSLRTWLERISIFEGF